MRIIPNPPDMAAVAALTSLSVAPLRLGSGTRIKILESFAWGIPVVSWNSIFEACEKELRDHLA